MLETGLEWLGQNKDKLQPGKGKGYHLVQAFFV
jgi:hypothetical protein